MALFKSKLTVSARYYMYATKKKNLRTFFTVYISVAVQE